MNKQKVLEHLRAIEAEMNEEVKIEEPDYQVGDWVEGTRGESSVLFKIVQIDLTSIHKFLGNGEWWMVKGIRRPQNITDIKIRVDNRVVPEWIKGKEIMMFWADGTTTQGEVRFLNPFAPSITHFMVLGE